MDIIVEKTEYQPDFFTKVEIGRHWFRLLKKHLPPPDQAGILQSFSKSGLLQFQLPPDEDRAQQYDNADVFSHEIYHSTLTAFANRDLIDGGALIDLISDEDLSISERILGNRHELVDELADRLLEWSTRIYSIKAGKSKAWHTAHMEYQFEVALPVSEVEIKKMEAKEFFGDDLDWYQFNFSDGGESDDIWQRKVETREEILMPSQVRYPGMPSTRWWKMEDNAVNFGNVKLSSTNLSSLLFSQFALVYGNDWIMTPLRTDVGAMYQITSLIVRDNFGIPTQINHLHEVAPNENWNFLQFQSRDPENKKASFLFLPPSMASHLRSKEYEKVNFIRDEMANMVWGIEEIIPDAIGGGSSGSKRATALKVYLAEIAENTIEQNLSSNQAKFKYLLEGSVPENWIPFIPVRVSDEDLFSRKIQLQRASMPRIVPGFSPRRVRPKSLLLQDGLSENPKRPMFLYEEEVPRSGAIVTGKWKRTRWYNGETYVWFAWQKTNGRGEESSGLKFDTVKYSKYK
ncbi:MAG: hypothetical protein R2824_23245 [Saprospiraceae bacterium]